MNVALSSAVSSLLVIEKQMGVASNNISNANTKGYSEESVQLAPSVSGGVGTGVTDLGVTSEVNQFLLSSVLQATTQSAQAGSFNTLYQNLENALGTISSSNTGGNDIASQLSTLQTALSTLAATPSNSALTSNVVNDLNSLCANLQSVSSQVQSLRTTADQDITSAVTDANTQLNTIATLNEQIATAQAQGNPIAALQDLRTNALSSLTSDLGVSSFTDANNQMQIYTTSGVPLLVGNTVNTLSHTAVSVSGDTTYANGTINGIMVGNQDITSQIGSGSIAAYIQMRDTELPNAQNALNTLAQSLSSTLNTAANQGTANPAPSTLTSATGISFQGTDSVTLSANLTIRVAMVNSSGQVQSYTDVNLGADLGTPATVNQIIADINSKVGSPVASLNGSGQMVLTATGSNGIAVATKSGTMSINGSTATNFSAFFHLNDVLTSGSSAAAISVNSTLLKNSYLLPVATLNTTSTTTPFAGIGASDGSTATALVTALQGNLTFNSGVATSTTTEPSASAALGLTGTFTVSGKSGNATITVAATDSLTSIAAQINATTGTTGITASVVGTGAYQLQISSGNSALTFKNASGTVLSSLGLSSNPSGYLGSTTTTLSGYASSLISDIAARANSASTASTNTSTTLSTLQNNLSSQSGVNTDEETAKLTELQSAYQASARIISTVQSMFSALISAVGGS
jgi:flagellar hook-associated protein 1 FlgK